MERVRIDISYDGTDFGGWQRQKVGKPTVQGTLEQALSRIFDSPIAIRGAGRTDAGVHALQQVAHFTAPKPLENYNLLKAVNSLTPATMAITAAYVVPEDFHALASAEKKTYKYRILNSPIPDAHKSRFTTWIRHPLNLEYLNMASSHLVGEHDFKSFQTAGTPVKTTVRTLYSAQWTQPEANLLEFTVVGSGFLKQMVRNIVGTQLDLWSADAPPSVLGEILQQMDRQKAKGTAPPEGLFLAAVQYPEDLDSRCRKI